MSDKQEVIKEIPPVISEKPPEWWSHGNYTPEVKPFEVAIFDPPTCVNRDYLARPTPEEGRWGSRE